MPWGINPSVLLAAPFLALVIVAALWPSLLATADPLATSLPEALQPPSSEHFWGTDQTGRDVWSRVVFGTRFSLVVGCGSAFGAALIGGAMGISLGLAPRWIDGILLRAVEVLMAFPDFLIALIVLAVLGSGPKNVAIAVLIGAVPAYIRVARAETLTRLQTGFVQASTLLGRNRWHVALHHIVPTTVRSLLVLATIGVGTGIVTAAGLSFLGLGTQEPAPDWGLMLAGSRNKLSQAWWLALFPGLAIIGTVLSVSVLSRAVQGRQDFRGHLRVSSRRSRGWLHRDELSR
ncbi:ABC transporter permease [Klugiella xanthotipulae]